MGAPVLWSSWWIIIIISFYKIWINFFFFGFGFDSLLGNSREVETILNLSGERGASARGWWGGGGGRQGQARKRNVWVTAALGSPRHFWPVWVTTVRCRICAQNCRGNESANWMMVCRKLVGDFAPQQQQQQQHRETRACACATTNISPPPPFPKTICWCRFFSLFFTPPTLKTTLARIFCWRAIVVVVVGEKGLGNYILNKIKIIIVSL